MLVQSGVRRCQRKARRLRTRRSGNAATSRLIRRRCKQRIIQDGFQPSASSFLGPRDERASDAAATVPPCPMAVRDSFEPSFGGRSEPGGSAQGRPGNAR